MYEISEPQQQVYPVQKPEYVIFKKILHLTESRSSFKNSNSHF